MTSQEALWREIARRLSDKLLKELIAACDKAIAEPMLTEKEFNSGKAGKTPDLHRDFENYRSLLDEELESRKKKM